MFIRACLRLQTTAVTSSALYQSYWLSFMTSKRSSLIVCEVSSRFCSQFSQRPARINLPEMFDAPKIKLDSGGLWGFLLLCLPHLVPFLSALLSSSAVVELKQTGVLRGQRRRRPETHSCRGPECVMATLLCRMKSLSVLNQKHGWIGCCASCFQEGISAVSCSHSSQPPFVLLLLPFTSEAQRL